MAGVTDNGWVAKSFQTLLDELSSEAKAEFGEDMPTTPDSVFGQLANIFTASTKDVWDLGQAVTDSQNRDTATGVYLDYLASLIGLSRRRQSSSTGSLMFTGSPSATIPAQFPCQDQLKRFVLTDSELTLDRSNSYQATFSVKTVADSTEYTIVAEGIYYTYTSSSSATETEILDGLFLLLDEATLFTTELVDNTIVLTYGSVANALSTQNSNNLTLNSVGCLISATASDEGALEFEANTITTLGSSILTVSSVTNPFDFSLGVDEETDAELRIRMDEREQSTGTATKPSIEAALSEVDGVTYVLVVENITMEDDETTGVPAKSYETFIQGGDNDEIAEVIWTTKPATGNTYGDVTEVVIDRNGDEQVVKFSRLYENYAWIRVTYSINDEEVFPSDGVSQMINVLVDKGNSMYLGEDFEPTKFYGVLYNAVAGMYVDNIEIAVTESAEDTPSYQTTRIAIPNTTTLSFDADRVKVSL